MKTRMRWLGAAALALFGAACDDGGSGVPGGPRGDGGTAGDAGGGPGSGGGGGGGSGAGYVPDPIPEVDEEPPAMCADPVNQGFQFLDDACAQKRFPTQFERGLACPVVDDDAVVPLAGGGEVTYLPSSDPVVVEDVLGGIVPDELDVTVILVRRVGGVPHYRYLSNATADVSYQPWSTSKFLAAANAGARLRLVSGGDVGLTASVDGIPLGDLVTSMHLYDWDPFSSNALGRYFHDVGTRDRANDLVHGLWLGRPGSETFGGNYGEASPPLSYTFDEPSGPSASVTPDGTFGYPNHLASFTTAEALKRLVLHREEPTQAMPGLDWADVEVLLYGAAGSAKYGDWGGMSRDKAVYLQSGHDLDYLEARSHGRWRIFGKLGNGSNGELLDVAYGCFPVLDDELEPVPGWGRELVVAAHLPTGGSSWAERDRILARAFRAILVRVVDGRL
jgi:hypothetical protein